MSQRVYQEIDDVAGRVDYASSTIRYHGHASPGALETDRAWRIKQLTFDSQSRYLATRFANGNANFTNIWADRADLVYS